MSPLYEILFEPLAIKKLTLKNRYVMCPMGNIGYVDGLGRFTARAKDYFTARARGGTGLLITGLCDVAPDIEKLPVAAMPMPTLNPGAFMATAAEMTESVHAYGAKIFLQLTAGFGYSSRPAATGEKVAPSPITNRWDPSILHRALTREEIYKFIEGFADAALIAKSSGYDGVEVHAVHEGYLLDQFTMAFYNQRTDDFGGDLAGRLKFPVEVIRAIKSACGPDFPVSLRFSLKSFIKAARQGAVPGEKFEERGRDVPEGLAAARILSDAGYDIFNVDAGTYDSWYWNHPPMYFEKGGIYLEFARQVKQALGKPVIAAGRMDNPAIAAKALENGDCDLVGLARPLLADPDLPNKVRQGKLAAIRPCLSCHQGCMGRIHQGRSLSCAVNPACGHEREYELEPAPVPRKVMIAGGGLAGMEAARVTALRGHKVALYEKTGQLGGDILPGGQPPFKAHDIHLLKWYERELAGLPVSIHMNTVADRALVEREKPDVALVATGSEQRLLKARGLETRKVFKITDLLMNADGAGKRVAIIGAGLTGGELALWLRRLGREVTLVEITGRILGGPEALPFMNYDMLKDLLHYEGVEILLNTALTEVTADSIIVKGPEGRRELPVDTLAFAVGAKSNTELYDALRDYPGETWLLGDAREVRNIMWTIWDANEVARKI